MNIVLDVSHPEYPSPFTPEVSRQLAAETAYPDADHGTIVGTTWGSAPRFHLIIGDANDIDLTWNDGTGFCAGADPDKWFPDKGGSTAANIGRDICLSGCPLLEPCREHGLKHETIGTWGGLTARERRVWHRDSGGKRAGRTMEPIRHGTAWGYSKHRRHPELYGDPCPECRKAVNADRARQRRQQDTAS